MCQTDRYPTVFPDGVKAGKTLSQTTLCQYSHGGRPCAGATVFKHAPKTVPYGYSTSAPSSSPYLSPNQFPPTPSYTPRSGTPNYRSGDDSDRSGHRSGSSSSRRRVPRTAQAPNVFVNGQRVSSYSNGERIVLVNGPPTPRTPPQNHTFPNTAPPSPVAPYVVNAGPRQSSHRPVIVDDRPRIDVDFGHAPRRTHARNTSSSSYSTQDEGSSSSRRSSRREAEREARREAERQATVQSRIAAANARIANRVEVPLRRSNTSYYQQDQLASEMERLEIKEERRKRKEQEALDQRLRERMQPQRRATVGHGGRRPRVHYEEGLSRWE